MSLCACLSVSLYVFLCVFAPFCLCLSPFQGETGSHCFEEAFQGQREQPSVCAYVSVSVCVSVLACESESACVSVSACANESERAEQEQNGQVEQL